MGRFLLGLILGIILVPLVVLLYFKFGRVPVAVNDPPFPNEKLVTSVPLNARIDREAVKNPSAPAERRQPGRRGAYLQRQVRRVPRIS